MADVTPLLPALDALVTDYSSLIFDSSLVPLPVVFLAPDVEAYARRRGFYGTYADVAGDELVGDWGSAAERLDALLGDDAVRDAALDRARRLDGGCTPTATAAAPLGCTVRFWPASGPNGAPPQTPGSLSQVPNGAPPQTPGSLSQVPNGASPQTPGSLSQTSGRKPMTDARFSSDTGAALMLTGEGPQPASIELRGARAQAEPRSAAMA